MAVKDSALIILMSYLAGNAFMDCCLFLDRDEAIQKFPCALLVHRNRTLVVPFLIRCNVILIGPFYETTPN